MNLTGLSVKECPKACNETGCVISGSSYCAHPRKGGLQAVDQGNDDALDRFQKAQKKLANADANERFS